MALAPFFNKASLAAAQFLRGVTPDGVKELFSEMTVGVGFDDAGVGTQGGRWLLEITVNLCARLYPKLALAPFGEDAASFAQDMEALARGINPLIEFASVEAANALIAVGSRDWSYAKVPCVYAGASGWRAFVSHRSPRPLGAGTNPFGAGAAACLAAAQAFRTLFVAQIGGTPEEEVSLSLLDYSVNQDGQGDLAANPHLEGVTLVGAGAIGNAVLWALARCGATGGLTVVDPELVDDTNLQRYVLTDTDSPGRSKVEVARESSAATGLDVTPFAGTWAAFVDSQRPFKAGLVAAALDTAAARCAVQASLPKATLNAWTQAGDLGVSRHEFLGGQACLACLYLPHRVEKNEDQIIAEALKLDATPASASLMEVRNALYFDQPVDEAWLLKIAGSLAVDSAVLQPFLGKPLRTLYREGICGGAILVNGDGARVEVPMAFQSVMAGLMLAGELVKHASDWKSGDVTTKLNLMRRLGECLSERQEKTADGSCLCQDLDYVAAYRAKYELD
jgi:molybdopterin/thiamine biosynthesis adenylyltransferase